jgi:hypothetical protein
MKKFIKIIYLVIITFPLLFLNLAKASGKIKNWYFGTNDRDLTKI